MAQPAGLLALDGGDPRLSNVGEGMRDYAPAEIRRLHDPSVSFEEYLHYAKQSRLEEESFGDHQPGSTVFGVLTKRETKAPVEDIGVATTSTGEKHASVSPSPTRLPAVPEDEWHTAARALRTASWGAVFYLITTDILGPFSVSWAFSRMGYGPGVALYTVFGALAGYGGWMLWRMFLGLDSTKYPMRTYGDIAFRVYGVWARHSVNVLQSVQLVFNVGVIIIANGQGLAQVTKSRVCFSVCCLVWTVLGFGLGQVRTLQRFGWVAHAAIWMNFAVIFITMGVVAHSPPNFAAALASNRVPRGPVVTSAGPAPAVAFQGQVVGLMQAVYSYGGSMLFCEFMAEMRRPMDFWKAMLCAQLVIYFAYMLFGIYVYSFQGQFTINPAYQGISPFAWQTTCNVISLVSGLIAAGLYGNIGIKVLYQNIFKELFGTPDLHTPHGKWIWAGMVPVYWAIAFTIASAIPQVSNISGLVAAVCILQFTYTFPPFLKLGYDVQRDAMLPSDGFDPATRRVVRGDGGWRRWARGLKRRWYVKLFNAVFFLGACVTAVLGVYSSVLGIKAGFEGVRAVSSFGCRNPVG